MQSKLLQELKTQGLTLSNYKEPLKEIPKELGYGFYGVVLESLDKDKLQCHICGKLFRGLAIHIWQAHKMRVVDYRDKFMLARETALASDTFREELKERTRIWLDGMTEEEGVAFKEKHIRRIKESWARRNHTNVRFKIALETKNKRGTCPDQLLAKIQEVATKLGRTPSLTEFMEETGGQRYKHLIFTTFGSWKKALEMLGMEVKKRESFSTRVGEYTREELIEYLQIFAKENRTRPTHSDCRRGLIPSNQAYERVFGSLPKAREEARIDEILEDMGVPM